MFAISLLSLLMCILVTHDKDMFILCQGVCQPVCQFVYENVICNQISGGVRWMVYCYDLQDSGFAGYTPFCKLERGFSTFFQQFGGEVLTYNESKSSSWSVFMIWCEDVVLLHVEIWALYPNCFSFVILS